MSGNADDPSQADQPSGKPTESGLLAMVLLNLVVLALLAWWLSSWLVIPCRSPLFVSLGGAVLIWAIAHSVWRPLGTALGDVSITAGAVRIGLKNVASVLDMLHPRKLSGRALWAGAAVLAAGGVAALIWGPVPPEETPVIDRFTVRYIGTDVEREFVPGEVVEIAAGRQVLVRATALCQDAPRCTWGKGYGGLSPAGGCATYYTSPSWGSYDFLDVRAQSPCQTLEAWAGLHIKVVYAVP